MAGDLKTQAHAAYRAAMAGPVKYRFTDLIKAGVPEATVARWLRGGANVSLDSLERLAEAIHCRVEVSIVPLD